MMQRTQSYRRAGRGTLIVRASALAVGFVASVGLQLAEPEHRGPATWTTGDPSVLCAMDENGSFAFQ